MNRKEKTLRLLVIGAHPDDNIINAGGTMALFVEMGHAVKCLTLTNGDAGHHIKKGRKLAKIRKAESQEAARRLGIEEAIILDNHDGKLTPELKIREQVIKEIRKWKPDIICVHRPYDYHPDHRYTGIIVQDASYLIGVPNIVPGTPPLRYSPLFLYTRDSFKYPYPFRPDITIDITKTFWKKIYALDAHQSQMYEWGPWIGDFESEVPQSAEERIEWLAKKRTQSITPEMKVSLEKWYGKKRAARAIHAEAFEICEYGKQPTEDEIRFLFPMLPDKKNTT